MLIVYRFLDLSNHHLTVCHRYGNIFAKDLRWIAYAISQKNNACFVLFLLYLYPGRRCVKGLAKVSFGIDLRKMRASGEGDRVSMLQPTC